MGGKQALCFLYNHYRSKAMSGLFLLRTLLDGRQQYSSLQSLSPLIISNFSDRTTWSNTKIGSGRVYPGSYLLPGSQKLALITWILQHKPADLVLADCVRDRRYSQSSKLDVLRLGRDTWTVKPDYLQLPPAHCWRPTYLRNITIDFVADGALRYRSRSIRTVSEIVYNNVRSHSLGWRSDSLFRCGLQLQHPSTGRNSNIGACAEPLEEPWKRKAYTVLSPEYLHRSPRNS
jgi:hypothetical protein